MQGNPPEAANMELTDQEVRFDHYPTMWNSLRNSAELQQAVYQQVGTTILNDLLAGDPVKAFALA